MFFGSFFRCLLPFAFPSGWCSVAENYWRSVAANPWYTFVRELTPGPVHAGLGVFLPTAKALRLCYWLKRVFTFCNTSSTVAEGNLHTNSACLTFQSRLFIWSDNIAPLILKPSGIKTSKGYPFIWLVIGHKSANPTLPL